MEGIIEAWKDIVTSFYQEDTNQSDDDLFNKSKLILLDNVDCPNMADMLRTVCMIVICNHRISAKQI